MSTIHAPPLSSKHKMMQHLCESHLYKTIIFFSWQKESGRNQCRNVITTIRNAQESASSSGSLIRSKVNECTQQLYSAELKNSANGRLTAFDLEHVYTLKCVHLTHAVPKTCEHEISA